MIMIVPILILFEIIAFVFLALGILPFQRSSDGSLPLVNKGIFIFVAAIIFFTLALTSVNFEHINCYASEELLVSNTTTITSTCEMFVISDIGLSYINWGMGILSLMVGVIIIIMAALTKDDHKYTQEE
jgi:uncharacterized membrane protein YeiB